MTYCDFALDRFSEQYWPCAYNDLKRGRCVNMRASHAKGHQNIEGKLVGRGGYRSSFSSRRFSPKWHEILSNALQEIFEESNSLLTSNSDESEEESVATNLHHRCMNRFYEALHPATHFISHSACFSCLRELPEHPLPCGHVLCTRCITSYSTAKTPGQISLEECPLHSSSSRFPEAWHIRVKPTLAGVRILTLDG